MLALALFIAAGAPNCRAGAYQSRRVTGAAIGRAPRTSSSKANDVGRKWLSVAIEGDTVVVGGRDPVYVLRTSDGGATYDEIAKLTASTRATGTPSATPWRWTAPPSWSGPREGQPHGAVYVFRTSAAGTRTQRSS